MIMKSIFFGLAIMFVLGLPMNLELSVGKNGYSLQYLGLMAQRETEEFDCPPEVECPDVGSGGGVTCPPYGECGDCFKYMQVPSGLWGQYTCGCFYTGYQTNNCSLCQVVPC